LLKNGWFQVNPFREIRVNSQHLIYSNKKDWNSKINFEAEKSRSLTSVVISLVHSHKGPRPLARQTTSDQRKDMSSAVFKSKSAFLLLLSQLFRTIYSFFDVFFRQNPKSSFFYTRGTS